MYGFSACNRGVSDCNKNLLNLDCKDSIRFGICKMKGHLGRVSPSHFLQNVYIETSCVCFKNF